MSVMKNFASLIGCGAQDLDSQMFDPPEVRLIGRTDQNSEVDGTGGGGHGNVGLRNQQPILFTLSKSSAKVAS